VPNPISFFRRLSLRGKLFLNLALLCGVIAALAMFASWCMSTVRAVTEQTLAGPIQLMDITSSVTEHTLQCRRFEKDFFLNINDEMVREDYRKQWLKAFSDLQAAVAAFRTGASSPEDVEAARQWEQAIATYRKAMQHVLHQVEEGTVRTPQQANSALTPYKEGIRALTELAPATSDRKLAEVRQAEQDLEEIIQFFQRLILFVTLLAGVGCAVWGYRFASDLTRPLAALQEAARRFGAGDMTTRCDLQRDDELGELARCFNEMVTRTRQRTRALMRSSPTEADLDPDKSAGQSE
jgi:nitrogen fixation/metabolism regulation signal transduction histidine kinase